MYKPVEDNLLSLGGYVASWRRKKGNSEGFGLLIARGKCFNASPAVFIIPAFLFMRMILIAIIASFTVDCSDNLMFSIRISWISRHQPPAPSQANLGGMRTQSTYLFNCNRFHMQAKLIRFRPCSECTSVNAHDKSAPSLSTHLVEGNITFNVLCLGERVWIVPDKWRVRLRSEARVEREIASPCNVLMSLPINHRIIIWRGSVVNRESGPYGSLQQPCGTLPFPATYGASFVESWLSLSNLRCFDSMWPWSAYLVSEFVKNSLLTAEAGK